MLETVRQILRAAGVRVRAGRKAAGRIGALPSVQTAPTISIAPFALVGYSALLALLLMLRRGRHLREG